MNDGTKQKASDAFAKGKFAKAAELYAAYCASEPRDHQARVRLGDAHARAGARTQAVDAYQTAAQGFAKDGFLPRAIAASKLVLELDPAHAGVQQMLADLYAEKKEVKPPRTLTGRTVPSPRLPAPPAAAAPSEIILELEEPARAALVPPPPSPPEAPIVPRSLAAELGFDEAIASPPSIPELEGDGLPERPKFDELELDVEAAAAALKIAGDAGGARALEWGGTSGLVGDSLLHAVELAAEASPTLEEDEPEEESAAAQDEAAGGLPRVPLFSDLPGDAFIELFQRCPLRRFSANERIIAQGTRGESFFVVCAGRVRVVKDAGDQARTLAELGEGDFFGEMALLSGAPRAASVDAVDDETQLLEISAVVLAEIAQRHPSVAQALRRFCRQRLLANLMASAPLFRPFEKKERKALAQRFRSRDVRPDEVLLREGKASDGLYVVLSGAVGVTRKGQRLAVLREGEIFGEMSLLLKTPANATVTAIRRTSLLRLPKEEFDALMASQPKVRELVTELNETRTKAGWSA